MRARPQPGESLSSLSAGQTERTEQIGTSIKQSGITGDILGSRPKGPPSPSDLDLKLLG